jgi:hypothetical protein
LFVKWFIDLRTLAWAPRALASWRTPSSRGVDVTDGPQPFGAKASSPAPPSSFTLGLAVGDEEPVAVDGLFSLSTDVSVTVEHANLETTRLASIAPFALSAPAIATCAVLFFSAGNASPGDAFVDVALGIFALVIGAAMVAAGIVLAASRDVRRVTSVERPRPRTTPSPPRGDPPEAATYAVPP